MSWDTIHKLVVNNLVEEKPHHMQYITKKNANIPSSTGTTPLHLASLASYPTITSHLLSVGAKVNVGNEYGETPLHWACKSGCLETVRLLVKHGAFLNAGDMDGNTPLHWLAENDHPAIVAFLLGEEPKLVQLENHEGQTAIHIACEWKNYELVEFLLQHAQQHGFQSDITAIVHESDDLKLIQILRDSKDRDNKANSLVSIIDSKETTNSPAETPIDNSPHIHKKSHRRGKRNPLATMKHALEKLHVFSTYNNQ
uniref:Uncharacterized protein n=1 Tax=Vannella robusta TaxID=1487602 RepID=A0A7S4HIR8_9EUKA|mmetsp:Transcript_11153/g.13795  ORF Transcript_11153/g.13795 Transcript_11153/m.13795 type:complete len:255 (+) Transcript_11153:114-878(+)